MSHTYVESKMFSLCFSRLSINKLNKQSRKYNIIKYFLNNYLKLQHFQMLPSQHANLTNIIGII